MISVQQLCSVLKQLSVTQQQQQASTSASARSRRRRRARARKTPTPVVVSTAPQPPKPQRKRRRRRNACKGGQTFTLSKCVLVKSITSSSPFGFVPLQPTQLSFVKAFSKVFEQARYNKVVLKYVPSASSTSAGVVLLGTDPDNKVSGTVTKETVAALNSVSGHVTQPLSLTFPLAQDNLVNTFWGVDTKVGQFVYYSEGQTGDLWLDVSITFAGPANL